MDRLLSEPIWQDIEYRATYAIVQNYIEKVEETSRLLLLFLFGFISSIEIDGHIYSLEKSRIPSSLFEKLISNFSLSCLSIYMKMTASRIQT